jgi:hypothetical protein
MKVAGNEKDELSALIKILLSAFQLNSVAASFSFDWEAAFESFMGVQETASSAGTSSLDVACIMGSSEGGIQPVYIETLSFLLSGPIVVIVALMLLVPLFLAQKAKYDANQTIWHQEMLKTFYVAMPVVFFLLHPTLTQRTMALYHCTTIQDTEFLTQALDEECWTGDHLTWLLIAGVPMTIIYVVGIPAAGFFFLRKNKGKLQPEHPDFEAFNAKYSFLYKGYAVTDTGKLNYAYGWEFMITARKVLLMFVLVFFARPGQEHVQSLLGLLVIVLALIVHSLAMPFDSKILNVAEFVSLVTSFLTFFLGQFTYTESDVVSDGSKAGISYLALVINMFFIVFMSYLMIKAYKSKAKTGKVADITHSSVTDEDPVAVTKAVAVDNTVTIHQERKN